MHELSQKLIQLNKLLVNTERLAKLYLNATSKCSTELDDDDKVVIPFDEKLYTRLLQVYTEVLSAFSKDEVAIDSCLDKIAEMQRMGSGYGGKNPNTNASNYNNPMSSVNPAAFNTNAILGNVNTTSSSASSAGKDHKRKQQGKSEPDSPAKKVKRNPNPKKGVPPSPSSPTPSYIAQVGDLAAARAPNSDQWILVRITGFNHKTGRYEVEDDAPDEEEPIAKKFHCPPENIVLLPPAPSSISATAQQPQNSIGSGGPGVYLWYPIPAKASVLAMFPATTTFYPAKVVSSHKKGKVVLFYQLQFDDDQEGGSTPARKVDAQYVIPLPKDFA